MPTHERTAKYRQIELQAAKTQAYQKIQELVLVCFEADRGIDRLDLGFHVTSDQSLGIHVTPYLNGRPTPSFVGLEALKAALCGREQWFALVLLDFRKEFTFVR